MHLLHEIEQIDDTLLLRDSKLEKLGQFDKRVGSESLAYSGQYLLKQLVILLLTAKLALVCQAYGFFQHVGFDFKFFGNGLDRVIEPTSQGFNLVHDLHAFVDDLIEFLGLFCVEVFG